MLPDGLCDVPDALEADGEDDVIAGAEADGFSGGGAVIDGDPAFEDEAFFDFVVFPVEFVRAVRPDGPVFTRLSFRGGGFAYDNVFYSRHNEVSFPKQFFPGDCKL